MPAATSMDPQPLLAVPGAGTRGLQQLNETQRTVADTQQVGADIIETLGVQREQLTGAVQTQNEMESVLTRSSNLIKRMLRRADMIKLTLWLIVFALLCTIVGIALYRWGPNAHGKHSPSPPTGPQQPLVQASASAASAAASAATSAAASAAAKAAPSSPLASAGRRLQERRRLNEVRPLGGGVVILLVVSVLTLLGCYFAGAMQPARRACVSCSLFVLFSATLLFLSCYPRQTDEWRDYAGPTDASPLLRSLFALLLFLTALAGPIAIAATHLAPPQRIDWPPPLSACKEEAGGAA
uniref:t-SNARE coiled-coil homology domain-containing protein n=1 Tax=Emiliania huxleyi TaxID=2903 RepID=A0A7S3TDP7_EMIHU